MIVTVDNIVNGITKFIETDLFDKASGYQKFVVALLSARVNGKLKDVIMPFLLCSLTLIMRLNYQSYLNHLIKHLTKWVTI